MDCHFSSLCRYCEGTTSRGSRGPYPAGTLSPNTAPCIAYVSWKIKAKNPKANIVVTPSDHIVMDVREFARVITSAMRFTADSDAIVTLGMKATRPKPVMAISRQT